MQTTPEVVRRECQRVDSLQSAQKGQLKTSMKVAAILPASGSGLRMGTPVPKQFWPILDKPLLLVAGYYTLEAFECVPWLDMVVVPVSADRIEWLRAQQLRWNLRKAVFIVGGGTRHRSIHAGVLHLADRGVDVVIVHDAVRPFVDEPILRAVTEAAHEHGVAGTVLPLVSTIVQEKDGFLEHALDRSKYRASQTPQAFRFEILRAAYACATKDDFDNGTECLHLALTYSKCRAKLIEGTADLFKVTYKPDVYAAEQLVKERCRQVVIVTGGGRGIGREVVMLLAARGIKVVAVARTKMEVEATCSAAGAVPVVADVSDPAQVAALFERVIAQLGRVDAVVNNAGQAARSRIEDMVRVAVMSRTW